MFNERFTFDNPDLKDYINDNDNPEDDQLENLSSRLATYAKEVRRFSVLLEQVRTWEIYQVAIYNSDPHIALVLAAAKDNTGNPQFPTKDSITDIIYNKTSSSLLQDGVRRVSIAFTASVLIGQLSQVPEQFNHFESVRDQAIADLDRIVSLPDIQDGSSESEDTEELQNASFYLSRKTISLPNNDELTVKAYISSGSNISDWETVQVYDGSEITTATIVADLADYINQAALVNKSVNLIASPILSGESETHALKIFPRERLQTVISEIISIKFLYYDSQADETLERLPFNWGVSFTNLTDYSLNSAIVTLNPDGTSETDDANDSEVVHSTLFFRSDSEESVDSHELKYRISPTSNEVRSVFLETSTPKEDRPSRLAFKLINDINSNNAKSNVLGAIIRNDDLSAPNPISGISAVSHSVTNPERNIVLDILEIPKDILVSIGNLDTPLTTFSSKPKSLVISSNFKNEVTSGFRVSNPQSHFTVYKLPRSKMLDVFRDEDKIY